MMMNAGCLPCSMEPLSSRTMTIRTLLSGCSDTLRTAWAGLPLLVSAGTAECIARNSTVVAVMLFC